MAITNINLITITMINAITIIINATVLLFHYHQMVGAVSIVQ